MTTRRGFLAGLLAAGAAPTLSWADAGSPAFLAAAQEPDGSHALYGLNGDGGSCFRVALPARGHAGAGHPTLPVAVAIARRPGHFALVIDCVTGNVLHRLVPPAGSQFNGHGAFLDEGRRLLTSEQVAETSEGRIGVWDASTWKRIGEWATGGVGPHDLRLLPGGRALVVANGGIATDPTDRAKLNIDTMRPSLGWLDSDGVLTGLTELAPELSRNSIRHLALRADGLVAFAMQWEGEPGLAVPLLGLTRAGETPRLASVPEAEAHLMQGYAGSVAWSGDGTSVAITSPRGGRLQRFDDRARFLDAFARPDICGAAPLGHGLMTSDGGGAVLAVGADGTRVLQRHPVAWDNHIVAL